MKKRCLFLALALCLVFCAGCGGEGSGEADTTAADTGETVTTEFSVSEDPNEKSAFDQDFDFSAYMELGDYSSKDLEAAKFVPVTDEYVNNIILSTLAANGYYDENTDAESIRQGDVAVIAFESMIDGEEYSGGSESGFAVLVGMGQFIPEVEEALVGRGVGDEFEMSGRYPDDYYMTNIAGKTADFSITVEKICTVRELTDDIAAELYDDDSMTADKLAENVKSTCEAAERLRVCSLLWNYVSESAEVKDVPVCDRMRYCRGMMDYYRSYAESLGHSYEELLESWEITDNEFFESLYTEASYDVAEQDMILCAVCRREGFANKLTEDEYAAETEFIAVAGGYGSVETLELAVPRIQLEKVAFLNHVMGLLASKLGLV